MKKRDSTYVHEMTTCSKLKDIIKIINDLPVNFSKSTVKRVPNTFILPVGLIVTSWITLKTKGTVIKLAYLQD